MMLSPKAAALSDRGFCQSRIALPVPYVALISSEGIIFSRRTLRYRVVSSRDGEHERTGDRANSRLADLLSFGATLDRKCVVHFYLVSFEISLIATRANMILYYREINGTI